MFPMIGIEGLRATSTTKRIEVLERLRGRFFFEHRLGVVV